MQDQSRGSEGTVLVILVCEVPDYPGIPRVPGRTLLRRGALGPVLQRLAVAEYAAREAHLLALVGRRSNGAGGGPAEGLIRQLQRDALEQAARTTSALSHQIASELSLLDLNTPEF